jgi:hypothetical protein
MKNLFNQLIVKNNSMANGLVALAVISMIGLGCFCNKDKFDLGKNDKDSPTPTASATPSPSPTKEYKKADASKYEIPSDEELQVIVKKSLLDFNDALQSEDFTDFHRSISKFWQKQTSPDKMKSSFQNLIDGEADIKEIKDMKANFKRAGEIEREGSLKKLMAEGDYDTSGIKTEFELQYIPEGKEWKLFGIRVYAAVKRR